MHFESKHRQLTEIERKMSLEVDGRLEKDESRTLPHVEVFTSGGMSDRMIRLQQHVITQQ